MAILLIFQPRCCLEKFQITLALIEPSFDIILYVLQNFILSFYFFVFKALESGAAVIMNLPRYYSYVSLWDSAGCLQYLIPDHKT